MTHKRQLSPLGLTYVLTVATAGLCIVGLAIDSLTTTSIDPRWTLLAALTILSGSATVKLPSVPATISISETFVFTAVLLYGAEVGAVIVALDGLIISFWFSRQRRELHRVAFNVAAPAVSIWLSAQLYFAFPGITPLTIQPVELGRILLPLATFTVFHFLINSGLIAAAVATETNRSPFDIWRNDFLWLSLNYFGGGSLAVLLVVYTRQVDLLYLGIIIPLLLILYFTFKIPMARVEDANKHLTLMNSLYLSTIETLAMAIDLKDQVTHGHIRRVQLYAVGLAKALGVTDQGLLRAIQASALLHDMGKLAIPEHILNKPGRLSQAEFERMKLHASIGADMLSSIEFPYPVVPMVRHHHENWDGSGYPFGLRGTDIPIGARILSVVDCYDALTSDRPYRPSLSHDSARDILLSRRETMYDPLVVDTFLAVYPALAAECARAADLAPTAGPPSTSQPISDEPADPALDSPGTMATESLLRIQQVLRQLSGDGTLVFSAYNRHEDHLTVVFVGGFASSTLLGTTLALGQRTSGWAAANRQVAFNSDAALDWGASSELHLHGLRYCVAVPISDGGHLLGVASFYTRDAITDSFRGAFEAFCLSAAPWLSGHALAKLRVSFPSEAALGMVLDPVFECLPGIEAELTLYVSRAGDHECDLLATLLLPGDLIATTGSGLVCVRVGTPSLSDSVKDSLTAAGIRVGIATVASDASNVADLVRTARRRALQVARIA